MNEELILGSEGKVLLTIHPIGKYSPYEFDFNVELYTNPKKRIVINKQICVPAPEENSFYVTFDTTSVGVGDLTIEVEAFVPDEYFEDGHRTERVRIESVTTIIP